VAITVALLVQGVSLWRLRSRRLTRGSARPT
jgi:hypothetical protein